MHFITWISMFLSHMMRCPTRQARIRPCFCCLDDTPFASIKRDHPNRKRPASSRAFRPNEPSGDGFSTCHEHCEQALNVPHAHPTTVRQPESRLCTKSEVRLAR